MTAYSAIHKLSRDDDRAGFASGAADLDEWLAKYAWQNQVANNATTYVVTRGTRIAGYFVIAMAAVMRGAVPEPLARHRPALVRSPASCWHAWRSIVVTVAADSARSCWPMRCCGP